jgi:hypothetical protein
MVGYLLAKTFLNIFSFGRGFTCEINTAKMAKILSKQPVYYEKIAY